MWTYNSCQMPHSSPRRSSNAFQLGTYESKLLALGHCVPSEVIIHEHELIKENNGIMLIIEVSYLQMNTLREVFTFIM